MNGLIAFLISFSFSEVCGVSSVGRIIELFNSILLALPRLNRILDEPEAIEWKPLRNSSERSSRLK